MPDQLTGRIERKLALVVAGVFVLAGTLWVLATDVLLYRLVQDPTLIARLETAKGWAFVAFAAALLYVVTFVGAQRVLRVRAALATVVDSIGDGLLLLGPARTIVHANPAAARMLNSSDLVGVDAREFSQRFAVSYLDGTAVPPDEFVSQRVFSEGGPLRYKATLHPPGAPELIVSCTAAAVRERADERPSLVVSVMHDITATEQLDRLRDEFFSAAAHALKTPVAIIKTNAQSLGGGDIVQLHKSIAVIERQCSRIDRHIQNMLVLARMRSKTLKLRHDDFDLAPLIQRITREMAACSTQCSVHSDIAGYPRVRADAERLGLCLRDLIDQACRCATPASNVIVELRADGPAAEIGVRYRPLAPNHARDDSPIYDEPGVDRLVVQTIVRAHGWILREHAADGEAASWVRLPAL